jgi:hypothetical protein
MVLPFLFCSFVNSFLSVRNTPFESRLDSDFELLKIMVSSKITTDNLNLDLLFVVFLTALYLP